MPRSDWNERVRVSVEASPAQPATITQWALRFTDGQTLIYSSEETARANLAANDQASDPCVLVTRTVTVSTTGWSEPGQSLNDVLVERERERLRAEQAEADSQRLTYVGGARCLFCGQDEHSGLCR